MSRELLGARRTPRAARRTSRHVRMRQTISTGRRASAHVAPCVAPAPSPPCAAGWHPPNAKRAREPAAPARPDPNPAGRGRRSRGSPPRIPSWCAGARRTLAHTVSSLRPGPGVSRRPEARTYIPYLAARPLLPSCWTAWPPSCRPTCDYRPAVLANPRPPPPTPAPSFGPRDLGPGRHPAAWTPSAAPRRAAPRSVIGDLRSTVRSPARPTGLRVHGYGAAYGRGAGDAADLNGSLG